MTKLELVREISRETGVDVATVAATIEGFMSVTQKTLASGENLYLRGFGSLTLLKRATKTARNITKGETMIVPEHFIPKFKAAPDFMAAVAHAPVK